LLKNIVCFTEKGHTKGMDPLTMVTVRSVIGGLFGIGNAIFGHKQRKRQRREALRIATESNQEAAQKLQAVAERQWGRSESSAAIAPTQIAIDSAPTLSATAARGIAKVLSRRSA
jgi:hypothetical protein